MDAALDGCRAKLERAREHLNAFEEAYEQYFTPRPFAVRKSYDVRTREFSFVSELMRPVPLRLGVILGDLVHNLRSALDHLVWQAVLREGAMSPDRRHQLPICDSEADWDSQARHKLAGINASDLAALRAIQPFNVALRPTPLQSLRDLSNLDKHRVVTPVMAAIGSAFPTSFVKVPLPPQIKLISRKDVDPASIRDATLFTGVPIAEPAPLVTLTVDATGPEPDIDLEGTWISGLMLEEGGQVNHVIDQMATLVEGVVNDFSNRWDLQPWVTMGNAGG